MDNINHKYTAITIGPIIETLNTARKTRELWGASYFFSYIIKQIVNKLNNNNTEVILPVCGNTAVNGFGAGLYPDRIFVVGEVDMESKYIEVIEDISKNIHYHLTSSITLIPQANFQFK